MDIIPSFSVYAFCSTFDHPLLMTLHLSEWNYSSHYSGHSWSARETTLAEYVQYFLVLYTYYPQHIQVQVQ